MMHSSGWPSRAAMVMAIGLLSARTHAAPAQGAATATGPCGACGSALQAGLHPIQPVATDTGRVKAIEYSSTYSTFMTIHRIGSYFELPLFVAEYFVGEKLLRDERNDPFGRSSVKGTHGAIAAGLGALFGVNTVTGIYGLVASRHEPAGRTRRWIHALTMLAADGGFLATAAAAESARESDSGANRHRALAIGSMGLAMVSTAIMWFWKD